MTIFLIIIEIFGALIVTFLISNKVGVDRLIKENKEVCDAHKKLGHPKLEKDIQYRILETGDLSPICKLIPELSSKGTPRSLLKHYITVSREDFSEYLDSSGFIEKHAISDDLEYKNSS